MSGRSGSGKTEIFRVLSRLMNAPFIRVEATRYTEVGFHGDDVTNIIVDLYKKSKLLLLSHHNIAHSELSNSRSSTILFMKSSRHVRK